MKLFQRLSLRRKLMLIIMSACALALFLSGTTLGIYEYFTLRRALVRNTSMVAYIIAENSHAALAFDDQRAATDLLSGVAWVPIIEAACIYDHEGQPFARFLRGGSWEDFIPPPFQRAQRALFMDDYLLLYVPVQAEDGFQGTVLLKASLNEFSRRMQAYCLICLGSLVLALGITFFVSARLQEIISGPILDLARMARRIGKAKNYALRARKPCEGEIGQLIDSFNGMLGEIATRDEALREAHVTLENRVEERTRELRQQIEERARAEEALRSSEERFRLVARATNDAIWDWDIPSDTISWNQGFEVIFGLPPDSVKSVKSWDSQIHPEDREGVITQLSACLDSEETYWTTEYRFIRGNGQYAHVLDRGYIIRGADGRAVRMVGAMVDVTGTKQATEDLKKAAKAADAANRAKSEFLATMSHEIRTPMNGVIGCTNLLFETQLSEEQREYVDTIQSSGRALMTLINDILDFSKIEAGRMELDTTQFDLAEAVEEVAELLGPQAAAKGLEVAISYDSTAPRQLFGDPGRIRQVLLNLLGNAIKFTAQGHIHIEISRVPSDKGGDHLRCAIHDTGIGVSLEKQGLLFQEFTQLDSSSTRRFGGTGLGLAISRRLVELMGGSIGVKSNPGLGSTFWFTLPMSQAPHVVPPPVNIAALASMRLLIVDDLEINRRVLAGQLKAWQLSFDTTSSGAEALEHLHQAAVAGRPYHVALLDHLMPDMDGEGLGRKILADPALKATALIMLTSASHRGDARRFLDLGFTAFLLKPVVRSAQLLTVLAETWKTHPLRGGLTRPVVPIQTQVSGSSSAKAISKVAKPDVAARPTEKKLSSFVRRVLVVEDNAVNQRVVVKMLERLNCRVDVAGDGREAVAMVRRFPYDLVLMDCLMPEMDGFEATEAIRRFELERPAFADGPRRLPIIALTANAMVSDRERCLSSGMDDHVAKPVVSKVLARVIETWVPEPLEVANSEALALA